MEAITITFIICLTIIIICKGDKNNGKNNKDR